MYIDTHCHLSKEDYDDIDLVVKENIDAGVSKMIISGCSFDSILESLNLIKKYKNIYATIGFHPSEADIIGENDLLFLEEKLKINKVVGIGEIGLDYHYGKENILKQKDLFRQQLCLADKYKLPVVIHSRDATLDTINILKEFSNVKGVIHCFNGSLETAKEYISLGYYLGIGGVITFKNCKLSEVINKIGLSNIVFETDSPYLTPVPFRGKKNSSKYLFYISKKVSECVDKEELEVSKIIESNTYELFDLK